MKDPLTIGDLIFILLMCAIMFISGCWLGRGMKERDAIEAGVAEYYLDSNHNKQFRWKTQQTQ